MGGSQLSFRTRYVAQGNPLTAPPHFDAILGVPAGALALGVTWPYNRFGDVHQLTLSAPPGGVDRALAEG